MPGRLFCFIWIITGINIIAIFTALVTATVTASTRPYFNIHGAKVMHTKHRPSSGITQFYSEQPLFLTKVVKYG